MENKNYYGVQWVDDGGPFNHWSSNLEEIEDVFQKMEISIKIIEDGFVELKTDGYQQYIVVDKPIPYWGIPSFVSNYPERYSESADLWLYTFKIQPDNIQRFLSEEEWDEGY